MQCAEIKNLIPLYLDQVLDSKENQLVAKHLTTCLACQKELNAIKRTWNLLEKWPDIKPSSTYVSEFWTKLSSDAPWYKRVLDKFKQVFVKEGLAPVLVTVCIILVVGVVIKKTSVVVPESEQAMVSLNPSELEMIENVELAENYDIVQDIDFLQDLDVIENCDDLET